MSLRRKKWEEIAELIGSSGTVRKSGKDIKCVIKEIIIQNVSGEPELIIVAEDDKRYPLKRFEQSKSVKEEKDASIVTKEQSTISALTSAIIKGRFKVLDRNASGIAIYEVYGPLNNPNHTRKVLFNERVRKVIKVI